MFAVPAKSLIGKSKILYVCIGAGSLIELGVLNIDRHGACSTVQIPTQMRLNSGMSPRHSQERQVTALVI